MRPMSGVSGGNDAGSARGVAPESNVSAVLGVSAGAGQGDCGIPIAFTKNRSLARH